MRDEKRSRQFIDSRVQGALVRQVLRQWVLFFVATFILLLGVGYMFGERHWTFAQHLADLWDRCGLVYLAILVMLPAFLRDTVKLSHRFVGPVVRVRNELHRLALGQVVEPVRFRKNDYWHDLADALNRVVARAQEWPTVDQEPAPVWPPAAQQPRERSAELVRS
jgi:hypothetical protein